MSADGNKCREVCFALFLLTKYFHGTKQTIMDASQNKYDTTIQRKKSS